MKPKKQENKQSAAIAESAKAPQRMIWPYLLPALMIALAILVRLRLLSVPLERDEGEYAYMGQTILAGIQPYAEAYNMKLPGTYYLYALIMALFGQTPTGIHLGLLLFHLGSVVWLYLIGKKLLDAASGAAAAAVFAFLCLIPWTYGLAGHASHFIAFFSLGGLYFLLKTRETPAYKWFLIAGLFFGTAFIVKQQAVFMLLFGVFMILRQEWRQTPRNIPGLSARLGFFALGSVLPYAAVVANALASGTFDQFWHWTVAYAGQYVGINDVGKGAEMFSNTFKSISTGATGFWLLGLGGLAALLFGKGQGSARSVLLWFALFSFLSICPGLYFRNHYFIAFFPALALVAAAALGALQGWDVLKKYGAAPAALLLGALAMYEVYTYSGFYFKYPVGEVCARMYGRNPFQESVKVADFIRRNSRPDERIAVFGSEPQIYFYSGRRAATGYLYTYPLMENQPYHLDMQKDMIAELEASRPRYVVVVNSNISWLASPQSDNYIMKWFESFSAANYHPVGLVDMVSPVDARYIWRPELDNYQRQAKENILILERN